MGLFDAVNKAVADQQQHNDYETLLKNAGITVQNFKADLTNGVLTLFGTVSDTTTGDKAVAALKNQPGVTSMVNLLEIEDLTAKNIFMLVNTANSNLNVRRGPGTEYDVVGKAAHHSKVQLLKRMYNNWYYIKTDNGIEGFCAANFLQNL
ncbi:SH3 domain-containing protein [Mucilaginibacter robiniae]|uniref:SH3 domain-containing protein n=1 Tax=Mucilaginibacter robiniae TaxID=2728022 RepID=A0A7L5DZ19_9SPHI|nr:SH3 domain-containing protein [Mucilaginibacter robiniae]QJD94524.1 SH3 domain-containing protein [Mucilaginibacter robiniae]